MLVFFSYAGPEVDFETPETREAPFCITSSDRYCKNDTNESIYLTKCAASSLSCEDNCPPGSAAYALNS